MANDAKVEVQGIKELQRSLKQIDRELPKELAAGLAEASQIVVTAMGPKIPQRSGDAARSVKVKKDQRSASIAVGGSKAPYYPWLDFGGRVGRGRTGKGTGSAYRPVLKEGRYLYPSLREKRPEVNAKVDEVLGKMAEKAGFETEGRADG